MLARVAMPAVRQKRSKLAPTSCQASSMVATGTTAADVVGSFMALLSFVDSAPRAYRLKVGNACPPISTSNGTSPRPNATLLHGSAAVARQGLIDAGGERRKRPEPIDPVIGWPFLATAFRARHEL